MTARPARAAIALTLALVALATLPPVITATADLPAATGSVTDLIGVFTPAQRHAVESLAHDLQTDTGTELAVAIVTSLDGMSVEDYASRLFASWGLGRQGRDDGVLVVVAPSAREVRIEVGDGLKGVIPDDLAGEIVREQMIPRFEQNDYGGGIQSAATRVAALVRVRHVVTADERQALERRDPPPDWVWVLFLGAFVGVGGLLGGVGLGASVFAPAILGAIFVGIPLTIASVLLVRWGLGVVLLVATAATATGWRLGRRPGVRRSLRMPEPPGWQWGGVSSSAASDTAGSTGRTGASGSRSSGSGFGGGRSGGGGASGRW